MASKKAFLILILSLGLVFPQPATAKDFSEFSEFEQLQIVYAKTKIFGECILRRLRENGVELDSAELQKLETTLRIIAGITSDDQYRLVMKDGSVDKSIRSNIAKGFDVPFCYEMRSDVDLLVKQIIDARSPSSRP